MNFERLSDYVQNELVEKRNVTGCDIAVIKDGNVVYRKAFGYADAEKTRPMTGNEMYFMYSATKPVTCTGAVRLIEKGLMNLDDPVSKYLPEFSSITVQNEDGSVTKAKNIMTVKHLFTMTAGFDYNLNNPAIAALREKNPDFSTREFARAMSEYPLRAEPGSRFIYSLCHDVLAAVCEVVSGMRFKDYQKENIFSPLGMTNTFFHKEECNMSRLCKLYNRKDAISTENEERPLQCAYTLSKNHDSGGAGMVSCVEDYIKFLSVLSNGGVTKDGYTLLSKEGIDLMRKNHLPIDIEKTFNRRELGYSYGLGVRTLVDKEIKGAKSNIGEYGWDGAAGTFLLIDPDAKVGLIYTQHILNMGCGDIYTVCHPKLRDLTYESLEL